MDGEPWVWGDVFEVQLPAGWHVQDIEDGVEIRPPDGPLVAHLALLAGGSGRSPEALAAAFARSRGATADAPIRAWRDERGARRAWGEVTVGRAFWLLTAIAWGPHLVLATACDFEAETAHVAAARELLGSVRPIGGLPGLLPPDPPGEF